MNDTTTTKKKRPSWGDPGSRVVRKTSALVYSRGSRQVIVAIYPDGIIGLRLSKHRREEFVSASDTYRRAVTTRVALERATKRAKRKGKGKT